MSLREIFYENIIKEAATGRINSFFYYNIIFSTLLGETGKYIEAKSTYDDLLIPMLNIKNMTLFDSLMETYVNKALDFYDNDNFPEEVVNGEMYDETHRISKEKTIMALLFSNATIEDFSDPINFLRKRIDFFENTSSCKYSLGYSSVLDSNIEVEICKDTLNNETPYQFSVKCVSDDGEVYELPSLKFGVSENKAYIYAIQNKNQSSSKFAKQINRKLYKVGEGFSKEDDNFSIYEEGNLNDITPSFLVVANMFVSYMNRLGINDFVASSILLERWNGKVIANKYKDEHGVDSYSNLHNDQLKIQSNLTEKFLRTFLRLKHHCDNIEITSYPMEQSSNLCFSSNGKMSCNNSLLTETYKLMSDANVISEENCKVK